MNGNLFNKNQRLVLLQGSTLKFVSMGFLGSFSRELEAERSKATDIIISYHDNSYLVHIHFCSVTSHVYCKMHALIHESSPSCSLLCRERGPCLCGWNYCSYAVTTDLHLPRFGIRVSHLLGAEVRLQNSP